MTTKRQRGLQRDLRTARPEKRPNIDKYPARRFPIQHEIQRLEDELNAFNERIAELEDEGHRSHAMDVLKANALDFARRIDELRSLLVQSAPKESPKGCRLASRQGSNRGPVD
jgi:hypothetical protein